MHYSEYTERQSQWDRKQYIMGCNICLLIGFYLFEREDFRPLFSSFFAFYLLPDHIQVTTNKLSTPAIKMLTAQEYIEPSAYTVHWKTSGSSGPDIEQYKISIRPVEVDYSMGRFGLLKHQFMCTCLFVRVYENFNNNLTLWCSS